MTEPLYILVITKSKNGDLNRICSKSDYIIVNTFDQVQAEANNRNRQHSAAGYLFEPRLINRKICKLLPRDRRANKDLWVLP